jgi:hypothetical protein
MDNEKWERRKRINVRGDVEIGNQLMRVKSSRNDFGFLQCASFVCRM